MKVTIQFDGGCKPNPGKMYGSYSISLDGSEVAVEQEAQYGYGTNNVAEFTALSRAVIHTMEILKRIEVDPKFCQVEILTDSMIIRNRVMKNLKTRDNEGSRRMAEWGLKLKELRSHFGAFNLQWTPRETNVRKFGH